ncbi:hypothetical protein BDZ89DRAFT_1078547 [Hymenopellis radicata]|nr:hypothetical protein BDZ89DRAFT_1078547 [Hymenopellis radicata]
MDVIRQRQIGNSFGIGNGNQRQNGASGGEGAQRGTAGKVLNEEQRSDNEGTRINGIDAKDGHGSSRTHGKSAR